MKNIWIASLLVGTCFGLEASKGRVFFGFQWVFGCGLQAAVEGCAFVYTLSKVHDTDRCPLLSPEVQDFVTSELKDTVPNVDRISVHKGMPDELVCFCSPGFGIKTDKIVLGYDSVTGKTPLEALLDKKTLSSRDERVLNEYRFVVHHEGQHFKYHDHRDQLMRAFCAPTAVWYGLMKMQQPFMHRTNRLARTALALPAAIAIAQIGRIVSSYPHAQVIEQRADDGVPNDPAILQGGIDFMRKLEAQMRLRISSLDALIALSPEESHRQQLLKERAMLFEDSKLATHPHPARRRARLEARLQKVLAEQETRTEK